MVDLATQDVSAVRGQMAQNFNCLPRMTGATSSTSDIMLSIDVNILYIYIFLNTTFSLTYII